jgi:hypothetical protein
MLKTEKTFFYCLKMIIVTNNFLLAWYMIYASLFIKFELIKNKLKNKKINK